MIILDTCPFPVLHEAAAAVTLPGHLEAGEVLHVASDVVPAHGGHGVAAPAPAPSDDEGVGVLLRYGAGGARRNFTLLVSL